MTNPDLAVPLNDDAPYTVAGPEERRRLRLIAGAVVVVPFLGTLLAVWLAVTRGIGGLEIWSFAIGYVLTLMGITVGFHRHFAHRSFLAGPAMRVVLAALGSMAGQGPLIWWVATHRRHHRLSDRDGDPHSPQLASGKGPLRALKGFWQGHIAWMFSDRISNWSLFARDMLGDRLVVKMHQLYFPIFLLGIILPAAIGGLVTGTWHGVLMGFLWGGMVRICAVDHVLWCVGSICHMIGLRPFRKRTRDHSTNNLAVALVGFGEGLQNNHHAFPRDAYHGFRWYEPDLGAGTIRLLSRMGLVWDVVATPSHAWKLAEDRNREDDDRTDRKQGAA